MARSQRKYDHGYKVQAVKLAKEIGGAKAAKELEIPEGTIHTWLKAVRTGQLDIGEGAPYSRICHEPCGGINHASKTRERSGYSSIVHDVLEKNVSTNLDNIRISWMDIIQV